MTTNMKRLLVSTLLLLCTAVALWAEDPHFTLSHNGAGGNKKTMVYAKLAFGDNGSKYTWGSPGVWEVAAFVDGECRAINRGLEWNTYNTDREDYYNYFPLEVQGNYGSTSDVGKTITFKVYSHKMGLEYNLKTTQTIKFDGETHGSNNGFNELIPLSCTELHNFGMNDFEMSLNSTVDLASYLILTPSDATIPNNLAFSISPSTYTLTVTGNGGYQFKPTAVGYYGVEGHNIYTESLISIGFRGGTINVKKPKNYVSGLSINSGYENIEVNKNDSTGLNDLLKKALKVSYYYPNEDPDEVPEWVSSNTNIVGKNSNGKWVPLKTGTCTMTAQVYDNSGNVRKSASLQVKVTNHVTSIKMKVSHFWCNVGDDLTDYLPRTFEVLPSDADNKKVTYTWDDECFEKRSDGHIVAIADGLPTIKITSNDNSSIYGELTVIVMKVATDISIKQNQVNVKYMGYGEPQDISDAIAANFSFLPLGGRFDGAFPTITSDNEDVVKVSLKQKDPETTAPEATDPENPEPADPVDPNDPANLNYAVEAQALKAGTANLTISLEVPNNMEWSITSDMTSTIVQKTFKVVVGQGTPTAISLPEKISAKYGTPFDLTKVLTIEPADAVFDYSKLVWTCSGSNYTSDYERYFTIEGNILTPKTPTRQEFKLTATVEGTNLTATTWVSIPNPVTSLTVKEGYESVSVFPDEWKKLNDWVAEAFVVAPQDYTDYFDISSEDENIVEYDRGWFPKHHGTTRLYGRVYNYDLEGNDTLKFEAYITVTVKSRGDSISLPDSIVVNYGDTLDLKKVLTIEPADAVFDYSKLEWSCNIVPWKEWISIDENSILTTLQPGMYDFELTATVPDTELKATTVLNIQNKVMSLTVKEGYDTITVFKGDDRTLTQKVGEAFVITPKRYTDYLMLTSEDEDIVYESREWYPRKAGTTKIYARIYDYFDYKKGDFSKPQFEKYVTVVVQNRPEKISLPERVVVDYHETLDLTTVLTVEPADAVFDKSKLKWTYDEVAKQYFIIEGNTLKPQKPFMRGIYMKATLEGTDLEAETFVCIKNPAKSLTVREGYETVTVHVYEDEALKQKVSEAFVVDPEQCTDPLVITTENYEIAMPDPLREGNYVVARPGTTKFTATIYDYFDTEHKTPLFSKSITVVVLSAVEKISMPATTDMAESETLNLDNLVELTLYPNQNFHPANLIWTVEAGKESLVSIDDDRVLTALGKGALTLTATVPYTDLKASTVLTIHRPAKEMSIVSGFETVYVCVGSNRLNAILDDALLVLPLGYTDKVEWLLADDGILEEAEGVLTPVKTGTTKVRAYIGDKANPRLQTAEVNVEVGLQITGIAAKEPTLHFINDVFTRNSYITKAVKDNFVLTPEANLLDYHPVFDSSNHEIVYVSVHSIPDEDGLQPISIERESGTVTMGVTITVPDYDNSTSRTGKPVTKELRATFQIEMEEGLQRLSCDEVVTHVDDRYELKMKKVPENVEFDFDPAKFKVTFDTYYSRDFPDDWTFAEWEPSGTDPLTLIIKGKCVEYGSFFVYYDDEYLGGSSLTVAPRYTVADGWQWFALHNGVMESQKAIKDALGNNLAEIRTNDNVLVNDPDIGYIGDLQKLDTDHTYKLRMQNVTNEGLVFTIDEKVGSVFTGKTLKLKAGWNWIGNSYQYYQPISEVFNGNAFTSGDIVQAKDAFATWNGSGWVGSLKYVTPGQGLLLHLNKAMDVKLKGENLMKQNFTQPAGARAAIHHSALTAHEVAACRFADNMAMIARVDGVTDPLRTTILAFVDDECRGVSVVDADRLFITIHGNMGERVSFVAYDQLTGLYHPVNNQCLLSPMTGTLEHPFLLHASDATSVEPLMFRAGQTEEVYDLQGRKLNVNANKPGKGVYIVRPAGKNGKKLVR
jgi:hypothetical protein